MKQLKYYCIFLSCFFIFSCNNGDNNPIPAALSDSTVGVNADSSDHMATVSTASLDPGSDEFIHKAATGNAMEISLAKMAMNKSNNEAVKNISKTIADQHTELNIKLKDIAKTMNIPFNEAVNESQQNEIDAITNSSPSLFDKTYLRNMIENHKADIEYYKNGSTNLKDEEVKNYATNALPTLLQHLDALKAVEKNLK